MPLPTQIELKNTDPQKDFEVLIAEFPPEIIAVSSLSVDFDFISDFFGMLSDVFIAATVAKYFGRNGLNG